MTLTSLRWALSSSKDKKMREVSVLEGSQKNEPEIET